MSKFSSPADEFVYGLSLDGTLDDECGDVQFGGWFGSIWFAPSDIPELNSLGITAGYAILHEDSAGFVYVDYFDHHGEWETAWDAIRGAEETEADEH